ncbi:HNH endonuclease [Escherichia coli]|nr:HNH endonuclease [Escherichia coli]
MSQVINWNDYFIYSDGAILWKPRNGVSKTWNSRYAGKRAGCLHKRSGYIHVGFNRRIYQEHRIIWEMHNGPIPEGMEIDHIDHNKVNNHIENLRLVTCQDNNHNRSRNHNNKSGCAGVYWLERLRKWCAVIRINGKLKHLGVFKSKDDAIKARQEAEIKYGFHPNHGK